MWSEGDEAAKESKQAWRTEDAGCVMVGALRRADWGGNEQRPQLRAAEDTRLESG